MASANRIRYISVGSAVGIGASSHYLQFDRWGVLLDAGLDPNKSGIDALPDYDLLKNRPVNAIIITHAHLDHMAGLPTAIQHFPHARVYMTPATMVLIEQMLYHFLQVQQKKEDKPETPLFTEEYLANIHFIYQSFDYAIPFPLHGCEESKLTFTFFDAGHILGSAGVLIEWRGKRIFYTGNTRRSRQFILNGARYPESPIDILITESTYGANRQAEKIRKSEEVKRFARKVSERLRMLGVVLLPVFALGRTQEMITMIHSLRVKNQIPVAPIYITGLGLRINKTYDRLLHKIYPEYDTGTLRAMTFDRWDHRRKLKGPALLLSTSGMMIPGSPSFEYAQQLAGDPRNAIFFVGYADPNTPGGLFRERKYEALKILFNAEKIASQVEIFHFSAHSNRQELLKMVKSMSPRNVILTHGDQVAQEWMAENVRRLLPRCRTVIPRQGHLIDFPPKS